jgi:chromosome segregation ATPase
MRILKRIAAVVVMVISVLVLVLGLAGIAGTWMVRSRLDDGLGRIVTAAGAEAAGARQELDRLDAALTQASTQIAAVEEEAQALGTDLDQNRPLLTALTDKLGVDLAPLAARAREMMDTIRETVAAVNSIVETINALPFVSKPVPELEKLNSLAAEIDSFEAEVQNLRLTIEQRRSEIIAGSVSIVTTPAARIRGGLGRAQATVSGYSQRLGTLQENLSALRATVGQWLTWLAAILTLTLLWLALSQVALFVLGWRALRGLDLLPRRRKAEAPVDLAGAGS